MLSDYVIRNDRYWAHYHGLNKAAYQPIDKIDLSELNKNYGSIARTIRAMANATKADNVQMLFSEAISACKDFIALAHAIRNSAYPVQREFNDETYGKSPSRHGKTPRAFIQEVIFGHGREIINTMENTWTMVRMVYDCVEKWTASKGRR